MREELVRIENGIKNIEGYDILAGLQLQIYKHEICGIISDEQMAMEQLWKILQGKEKLDHGNVYINEKKMAEDSYSSVLKNNVCQISSQSQLIGALSLAENMFIVTGKRQKTFINRAENESALKRLLYEFTIDLDISMPVSGLNRLQRYEFELLKAYVQGIRLILLDLRRNELTSEENRKLFRLIYEINKRNTTFLVWNPVLPQLIRYSDYMIILKNGKTGRVFEKNEFDAGNVERVLLGDVQRIQKTYVPRMKQSVFKFQNISDSYLDRVSFQVRAGEILLIQCEQAEGLGHLYSILSGQSSPDSGYMMITNRLYTPRCLEDAIAEGVGFVKESAITNSLFLNLNVFDNICMIKGNYLKSIWWKKSYRQSLKKKINDWFGREICDKRISTLSESERQQVFLYKWMVYRPKMLVLVDPFIGGWFTMNESFMEHIVRLTDEGIGILILSSNRSSFPILNQNRKILTVNGELKDRSVYYV
ncbi:MAG: ATP-binding cassette domain-containing protein [Lachnospiraceae bacterium]|nr:ATP-binding cassette domain-containing protein [Lachnospiraceae bacterium]